MPHRARCLMVSSPGSEISVRMNPTANAHLRQYSVRVTAKRIAASVEADMDTPPEISNQP